MEAELLPTSIGGTTDYKQLSLALLDLHHRNLLVIPLLGRADATLHF